MRTSTTLLALGAAAGAAQAVDISTIESSALALLSSSCRNAYQNLTDTESDIGKCLKSQAFSSLLSSKGSLIPGVTSYLTDICADDPCSSDALANATQTIQSECASDLSKYGWTNETVQYIVSSYPLAREVFCLKTTDPNQFNASLASNSSSSNTTSSSNSSVGGVSTSASSNATSTPVSSASASSATSAIESVSSSASVTDSASSAAASVARRQEASSSTTENVSATGDAASGPTPSADSSISESSSASETASVTSSAAAGVPSANATSASNTTSAANSTSNSTSEDTGSFCVVSVLEEAFSYLGYNLSVTDVATILLGGNASAVQTILSIPPTALCSDCVFGALDLVETELPDFGTYVTVQNVTLNDYFDNTCAATGLNVSSNGTLPTNVTSGTSNSSFGHSFVNGTSTYLPTSTAPAIPAASILGASGNVTIGNTTFGFGNNLTTNETFSTSIGTNGTSSTVGGAVGSASSAAVSATSAVESKVSSVTAGSSSATESGSAVDSASSSETASATGAVRRADPALVKARWVGEQ
ncbi:hypothetical protein IAR50_001573 [Cryptococcus sp. DSM 104548]